MVMKVGDKVRVKRDPAYGNSFGWNGEMNEFLGQEVTIASISGLLIHIREDHGQWSWDESCFDIIAPEISNVVETSW